MTDSPRGSRPLSVPEEPIAFFGAVTAATTHDLNNVISIIDQTAGLLEDLVFAAENGSSIEIEQLSRVSESIQRQTRRGIATIKRLNRFAHTTDEPTLEFELNETLENLLVLVQRLADRREVDLKVTPRHEPIKLTASPFLIQHAIFAVYASLLRVSEAGTELSVSVSGGAAAAVVTFDLGSASGASPDLTVAQSLAESVGMRLETESGVDTLTVTLYIENGP
ncbi:hypothetical protein GF420_08315 [candidate division GN15 bacterium]|nr:hypothetical protein [candidate division GN15 bacterium]